MDAVTKSILAIVGAGGYAVSVSAAEGLPAVEAVSESTGERFVVRDVDAWTALVRAAEAAGFGFDDG